MRATDARQDVQVGGEVATLLTYTCHADASVPWVVALHEGRGYYIIWLNDPGSEQSDRTRFDTILETFAFVS